MIASSSQGTTPADCRPRRHAADLSPHAALSSARRRARVEKSPTSAQFVTKAIARSDGARHADDGSLDTRLAATRSGRSFSVFAGARYARELAHTTHVEEYGAGKELVAAGIILRNGLQRDGRLHPGKP